MNRKALIRKRVIQPLSNRLQERSHEEKQEIYRSVPDVRLLVIGVVLGILVMLIIFSSSGMLRDLLVAFGIIAELAALHWLSVSQG
jgi:hypothetical protein